MPGVEVKHEAFRMRSNFSKRYVSDSMRSAFFQQHLRPYVCLDFFFRRNSSDHTTHIPMCIFYFLIRTGSTNIYPRHPSHHIFDYVPSSLTAEIDHPANQSHGSSLERLYALARGFHQFIASQSLPERCTRLKMKFSLSGEALRTRAVVS